MKRLKLFALLLTGVFTSSTSNCTQLAYANEVHKQSEGITTTVRTLTKSKDPLVSKNLMRYYQPLEIEIKNDNRDDYVLTQESFGLPVTKLKCVARKYRTLPSPKYPLVGMAIGALVLGGGFFIVLLPTGTGQISNLFACSFLMVIAGGIYGTFSGIIGEIVRLFRSKKKNNRLKNSLLTSGAVDLEKPLMVPANTAVKKIVYIRKSKFNPQFNITLGKAS